MANVKVAFEILDKLHRIPISWKKSSGHLVFDVKMDFTRKAWWVKYGHKIPQPDNSSYAGVVSSEHVRIALPYAALNEIIINSRIIVFNYVVITLESPVAQMRIHL